VLPAAAKKSGKKLVVGYILRHHPSWEKFIELAQQLGKAIGNANESESTK
jgi:predicted dehydrogenase